MRDKERDFSEDPVGLFQLGKPLKVVGNMAGEIDVTLLEKTVFANTFLQSVSAGRIFLS